MVKKEKYVYEFVNNKLYKVSQNTYYNNGFALEYKNENNEESYAFFPTFYPYVIDDGKREIYCTIAGNVTGIDFSKGIPYDPSAPGEDFSMLLRTHAFYKAQRKVKKQSNQMLMIVIIVLAVIVIGIIAFMAFRGAENVG